MTITASMPASMPTSKKRCWTLVFKDIKNNVTDAELLSSFRKRYTSARKLAFRSPKYTAGGVKSNTPPDSNAGATNDHAPGNLSIEVQFTGPQPAEGPVGLLCSLLQGTFVKALPVQLDRGRKRKLLAVGARKGASPLATTSHAPSPGSGVVNRRTTAVVEARKTEDTLRTSAMETAEYDTASSSSSSSSSFLYSTDSSSISSSASSCGSSEHFDFRCEPALSVAGQAAAAAHVARMASITPEHADGTSTTTSTTSNLDDLRDDPYAGGSRSDIRDRGSGNTSHQNTDTDGVGAGTGASGGSTNDDVFTAAFEGVSLIDDLLERPREDGRGNGGDARPYPIQDGGVGGGGSAKDNMRSGAFGDESLSLGSSAAAAAAAAASTAADDRGGLPAPLSYLGRSCSATTAVAGGDLPKWDEVVRRAANTTPPAAAITDCCADDLPESSPGLAATGSFYECNGGKTMSQEEVVSLFADHVASTAAGGDDIGSSAVAAAAAAAAEAAAEAATAAGGVVVSDDGLWDEAPEDAYTLFSAPALGRPASFSWGHHPEQAATVVADDDDTGDDDDDFDSAYESRVGGGRDHQQAPPVQLQQYPSDWSGETRRCSDMAMAVPRGIVPPPAGNNISFAWREEPCQFALGGLRSVVEQGYDLRDLAVFAQFSVDPETKVETEASPMEVDPNTGNDQATAAVAYPSIWDIWPEVHKMAHVRAVEVDMSVEVRSRSGEVVYAGPTFKVTYQRPETRGCDTDDRTACRHVRRTSSSSLSSFSLSSSSCSSSDQEDADFGPLSGMLSRMGWT